MFPIAVIFAIVKWLETDYGINITAMLEEWANANPETVEGIFEFINKVVNSIEDFFFSL